MKTIFVKSGGYYETPGVAFSGAVNDIYSTYIQHFNKTDAAFRIDKSGDELHVVSVNDPNGTASGYAIIKLDEIIQHCDEHGFVYFGLPLPFDSIGISQKDYLLQLSILSVSDDNNLHDCRSGKIIENKSIMPLLYCVKMANDTYSFVVSGLAQVDSTFQNQHDGDCISIAGYNCVFLNEGEAVRNHIVDIQVDKVYKRMFNHNFVTGWSLFMPANEEVTIDVFKKDSPVVTDEFMKNFEIKVDTNFKSRIENNKIILTTPETPTTGYLSIELVTTPLYAEYSSREIKETMTLDFIASVL